MIKKLLDSSEYIDHPPLPKNKKDIDDVFLHKLTLLKLQRQSLVESTAAITTHLINEAISKPHYANLYSFDTANKLMLLEKIEKTMHTKIEESMLPKPRKQGYFEKIKPLISSGECKLRNKLPLYQV